MIEPPLLLPVIRQIECRIIVLSQKCERWCPAPYLAPRLLWKSYWPVSISSQDILNSLDFHNASWTFPWDVRKSLISQMSKFTHRLSTLLNMLEHAHHLLICLNAPSSVNSVRHSKSSTVTYWTLVVIRLSDKHSDSLLHEIVNNSMLLLLIYLEVMKIIYKDILSSMCP